MGIRANRNRIHFESELDEAPNRLTGRNATLANARRRIARDEEREKLRQAERTPKAIERTLAQIRARPKRRGPLSNVPDPIAMGRRFLADPVLRFWLGFNLCSSLALFVFATVFMLYLYPLVLRPLVKY